MANDATSQHALVAAVKNLAIEKGRTPTRAEFILEGGTDHQLRKCFGNYAVLLQAAGLKPNEKFKKAGQRRDDGSLIGDDLPPPLPKITNKVFEVDIEKFLEKRIKKESLQYSRKRKILLLGDVHFPFHSPEALEKVYEFAQREQPDDIIQVGDLYDFLAHSKFPRSHNVFSAREEERLARQEAEKMWAKLKELCPNANCHQLIGNHDLRPLKRILEAYPEAEDWAQVRWEELMTFPGVTTYFDSRTPLEIDGILFCHGFLGKQMAHLDHFQQNVVFGHLHKLWCAYKRVNGKVIFEMCCGFLADPESKALTYTPSKFSNYSLGFGYIDEYGPRVIYL